jgi:hypothetical protein
MLDAEVDGRSPDEAREARQEGEEERRRPLPESGPTGWASVTSARTGSPTTAATSGGSCAPRFPACSEMRSLVAPEMPPTIPEKAFSISAVVDGPPGW